MSLLQERAARGEALLRYEELRQRQVLLLNECDQVAKRYEQTAKHLRDNPAAMTFDLGHARDYNVQVASLLEDVKANRDELAAARKLVTDLGFHPSE